jgi:hypothetical protein
MTWGLLLRVAAAKTALLLLIVGLALRDKEALVIGAGLALAVGLLGSRVGPLARLAVALLGLNVFGWMAPAAVANIAHGEGALAVAVPLALSVGAIVTVVASVCDRLRRARRNVGGRPTVLAVTAGSVVVFLVGLLLAGVGAFGDPARARPGDVVLDMKGARFADEHITARQSKVGLVIVNEDLFWHTFTIDALDVDVRVPVKAHRRAVFEAPAGTYTYYCAIPGHRAIGMEGTLTVLSRN